MDLCVDNMHLKDPLVLFGFEDYVLSLPPFLLSPIRYALSLFLNSFLVNFVALNVF